MYFDLLYWLCIILLLLGYVIESFFYACIFEPLHGIFILVVDDLMMCYNSIASILWRTTNVILDGYHLKNDCWNKLFRIIEVLWSRQESWWRWLAFLCHILWHCEIKEKKKKNSWICIDRYVCVVYLFGTWRFHHNFVRGEPKSYTTGFNIKCKLLLFRWCNTSGRQYPAKIVHVCFSCRHTSWQSMTFFKSIEETFIRLRKMHELL